MPLGTKSFYQIGQSGLFWRRVTAIFVIIAFTLFDAARYAPQGYASPAGVAVSSGPALFSIPKELGKIDEVYFAERGTGNGERTDEIVQRSTLAVPRHDRMIVFIQDAHDSLEAQENIAKLIEKLVSDKGIKTVFEEGYEGPVPTDKFFGFIKDPAIKQKVSYFLLDKLRIGGAEYAHINRAAEPPSREKGNDERGAVRSAFPVPRSPQNDWQLIGVEDLKLYGENIESYRDASKSRNDIGEDLKELFTRISNLADRYFPKALKTCLKVKERFEEGKLPLLNYLEELQRFYPQDRGPAVFVRDYPAVSLLLTARTTRDPKLIEQLNALDSVAVFEEIQRLEQDISGAYLATERDRRIFTYYQALSLLGRLNRIELTQPEYEAVKAMLQKFETQKLADFIVSLTHRSLVLSKEWERHIKDAVRFYEIALQRDNALAKALDGYFAAENGEQGTGNEAVRKTGERETETLTVSHSPMLDARAAVLVYGGFHANNIKELLRAKGISYTAITPAMTGIDKKHQEDYKELMSVGHYSFEAPFLAARANRPPSAFFMAVTAGDQPVDRELRAIASSVEALGVHAATPLIEQRLSTLDQTRPYPGPKPALPSIRSEVRVGDEMIEPELTASERSTVDKLKRAATMQNAYENGLQYPYTDASLNRIEEGKNWGVSALERFVSKEGKPSEFHTSSLFQFIHNPTRVSSNLQKIQDEFGRLGFSEKFYRTISDSLHLTILPVIKGRIDPKQSDGSKEFSQAIKITDRVLKDFEPFDIWIEGLMIDESSGRIMANAYPLSRGEAGNPHLDLRKRFDGTTDHVRTAVTLLTPFRGLSFEERTKLLAWVRANKDTAFGRLRVEDLKLLHAADSYAVKRIREKSYTLRTRSTGPAGDKGSASDQNRPVRSEMRKEPTKDESQQAVPVPTDGAHPLSGEISKAADAIRVWEQQGLPIHEVAEKLKAMTGETSAPQVRFDRYWRGRDEDPGKNIPGTHHYGFQLGTGEYVTITYGRDGSIEYRNRSRILTPPYEIEIPKAAWVKDVLEKVRELTGRINAVLGEEAVDLVWVFGSFADGDWTRDMDDVDLFIKLKKKEHITWDVQQLAIGLTRGPFFAQNAGYIKHMDPYIYYSPIDDTSFAHDPRTVFEGSIKENIKNLKFMFKVQPAVSDVRSEMRGEKQKIIRERYRALGLDPQKDFLVPGRKPGTIDRDVWNRKFKKIDPTGRSVVTFLNSHKEREWIGKFLSHAVNQAGLLANPSLTVLDLMTGRSSYLILEVLERVAKGGALIGTDVFSELAVHEPALSRYIPRDLNRKPYFPELKDNSIYLITLVNGIYYLRRPLELFNEVVRLLAPGGLFFIIQGMLNMAASEVAVYENEETGWEELIQSFFRVTPGFNEPQKKDNYHDLAALILGPLTTVWAQKKSSFRSTRKTMAQTHSSKGGRSEMRESVLVDANLPRTFSEEELDVVESGLESARIGLEVTPTAFQENGMSRVMFDRIYNLLTLDGKRRGFGDIDEFMTPAEDFGKEHARNHLNHETFILTNSNLGFNNFYLAIVKGKVLYYAGDPLTPRTMLVVRNGKPEVMEVAFEKKEGGTVRAIDPKEHDPDKKDITDNIDIAIYGLPLVKPGKSGSPEPNLQELFDQLDDLRHLFRFPMFHFKNGDEWHLGMSDGFGLFYKDQTIRKRLFEGRPVTLTLEPVLRRGVTTDEVRQVFDAWGYKGHYTLDEERRTITAAYAPGIHPHSYFAVTEDGRFIVGSEKGGPEGLQTHFRGTSLKRLAEELIQRHKVKYAWVWANGKDVALKPGVTDSQAVGLRKRFVEALIFSRPQVPQVKAPVRFETRRDLNGYLRDIVETDVSNGIMPPFTISDLEIKRFGGSKIVAILNPFRLPYEKKINQGTDEGCPIDISNSIQGRVLRRQGEWIYRSNDFPVLPGRLMAVRGHHVEQRFSRVLAQNLVDLAFRASDYVITRNEGPNAGASILAHDHHQLIPWSALEAIFKGRSLPVDEEAVRLLIRKFGSVKAYVLTGWPFKGLVLSGGSAHDFQSALLEIDRIFKARSIDYNIIASSRRAGFPEFYIFPRKAAYVTIDGVKKYIGFDQEMGLYDSSTESNFDLGLGDWLELVRETTLSDREWGLLLTAIKTGARQVTAAKPSLVLFVSQEGRSPSETDSQRSGMQTGFGPSASPEGEPKVWVLRDTQTEAVKGLAYQTPLLPKGPMDFDRAWRDFHAMALEFPKILEQAARAKLPVVLVIPEKLEGSGPLADEAPWISGARTALAWASTYFRFKELGNVDVRVLQLPEKEVPQEEITASIKKLLSKNIRDDAATPEAQMEARIFPWEEVPRTAQGLKRSLLLEAHPLREITGEEEDKTAPEMILPVLPPIPHGKKRIVVTGAAGFIGINLVKKLLAEGHQVIALDDLTTGNKDFASFFQKEPNFFFKLWDVSEPFEIEGPVAQVLHLASLASPPDYYTYPREALRSGLQGTRETMELARRKHARFLFTSTSEVYGDAEVHPQSETYVGNVSSFKKRSQYDQSKRGAETLMKLYAEKYAAEGLDLRIARVFNTYGPFMRIDDGRVITNFIEKVMAGETMEIYGSDKITRSFGYVDDTVDGLLKLLRTDKLSPETPIQERVFNIGNDSEFTLGELAEIVNGLGQKYLHRTVPVHVIEMKDPSDPARRRPDLTRAHLSLGYAPRVSLGDGLEKTFLYFLSSHFGKTRSEARLDPTVARSEMRSGEEGDPAEAALFVPDFWKNFRYLAPVRHDQIRRYDYVGAPQTLANGITLRRSDSFALKDADKMKIKDGWDYDNIIFPSQARFLRAVNPDNQHPHLPRFYGYVDLKSAGEGLSHKALLLEFAGGSTLEQFAQPSERTVSGNGSAKSYNAFFARLALKVLKAYKRTFFDNGYVHGDIDSTAIRAGEEGMGREVDAPDSVSRLEKTKVVFVDNDSVSLIGGEGEINGHLKNLTKTDLSSKDRIRRIRTGNTPVREYCLPRDDVYSLCLMFLEMRGSLPLIPLTGIEEFLSILERYKLLSEKKEAGDDLIAKLIEELEAAASKIDGRPAEEDAPSRAVPVETRRRSEARIEWDEKARVYRTPRATYETLWSGIRSVVRHQIPEEFDRWQKESTTDGNRSLAIALNLRNGLLRDMIALGHSRNREFLEKTQWLAEVAQEGHWRIFFNQILGLYRSKRAQEPDLGSMRRDLWIALEEVRRFQKKRNASRNFAGPLLLAGVPAVSAQLALWGIEAGTQPLVVPNSKNRLLDKIREHFSRAEGELAASDQVLEFTGSYAAHYIRERRAGKDHAAGEQNAFYAAFKERAPFITKALVSKAGESSSGLSLGWQKLRRLLIEEKEGDLFTRQDVPSAIPREFLLNPATASAPDDPVRLRQKPDVSVRSESRRAEMRSDIGEEAGNIVSPTGKFQRPAGHESENRRRVLDYLIEETKADPDFSATAIELTDALGIGSEGPVRDALKRLKADDLVVSSEGKTQKKKSVQLFGLSAAGKSLASGAIAYKGRIDALGFEMDPKDPGLIRYPEDYKPPRPLYDLILVPHGQTPSNTRRLFQGNHADGGANQLLTPEGKEAVRQGAEEFWKTHGEQMLADPDKFVFLVTPLKRTHQTAGIYFAVLKEKWKERKPEDKFPFRIRPIDNNTIEIDHGRSWHDKTADEMSESDRNAARTYNDGDFFVRPVDGENRIQLMERALAWLLRNNKRYAGKTVILFGHGTFQNAVETLLRTYPEKTPADVFSRKPGVSHLRRGFPHLVYSAGARSVASADKAVALSGGKAGSPVIVTFSSLANYRYYENFGNKLYAQGIPAVRSLYDEAARALGIDSPDVLFHATPENIEIFSIAMSVHELAFYEWWKTLAAKRGLKYDVKAFAGISQAMYPSAVASGAVSISDLVRLIKIESRHIRPQDVDKGQNVLILNIPAKEFVDDAKRHFAAFEVTRFLSAKSVTANVPDSVLPAFREYVKQTYSSSRVSIVPPVTQTPYHTERWRNKLEDIRRDIRSAGISYRDPAVPIISGTGAGLIRDAQGVWRELLAQLTDPIDSPSMVEMMASLKPDYLLAMGVSDGMDRSLSSNGQSIPVQIFSDPDSFEKISETTPGLPGGSGHAVRSEMRDRKGKAQTDGVRPVSSDGTASASLPKKDLIEALEAGIEDLSAYPSKYGDLAIYYLIRDVTGKGLFRGPINPRSASVRIKKRFGVQFQQQQLAAQNFFELKSLLEEAYRSGTLSEYGKLKNLSALVLKLQERLSGQSPEKIEISPAHLTRLINEPSKVAAIVGISPQDPSLSGWDMPVVSLTREQFEAVSHILMAKKDSGALKALGSMEGLLRLLRDIKTAGTGDLRKLHKINLSHLTGLINEPSKIAAIVGISSQDPILSGWALPKVDFTWEQFEALSNILIAKKKDGTLRTLGSAEGLLEFLRDIKTAVKGDLKKLQGINLDHLTGLLHKPFKVAPIVGLSSKDPLFNNWVPPFMNKRWDDFWATADIPHLSEKAQQVSDGSSAPERQLPGPHASPIVPSDKKPKASPESVTQLAKSLFVAPFDKGVRWARHIQDLLRSKEGVTGSCMDLEAIFKKHKMDIKNNEDRLAVIEAIEKLMKEPGYAYITRILNGTAPDAPINPRRSEVRETGAQPAEDASGELTFAAQKDRVLKTIETLFGELKDGKITRITKALIKRRSGITRGSEAAWNRLKADDTTGPAIRDAIARSTPDARVISASEKFERLLRQGEAVDITQQLFSQETGLPVAALTRQRLGEEAWTAYRRLIGPQGMCLRIIIMAELLAEKFQKRLLWKVGHKQIYTEAGIPERTYKEYVNEKYPHVKAAVEKALSLYPANVQKIFEALDGLERDADVIKKEFTYSLIAQRTGLTVKRVSDYIFHYPVLGERVEQVRDKYKGKRSVSVVAVANALERMIQENIRPTTLERIALTAGYTKGSTTSVASALEKDDALRRRFRWQQKRDPQTQHLKLNTEKPGSSYHEIVSNVIRRPDFRQALKDRFGATVDEIDTFNIHSITTPDETGRDFWHVRKLHLKLTGGRSINLTLKTLRQSQMADERIRRDLEINKRLATLKTPITPYLVYAGQSVVRNRRYSVEIGEWVPYRTDVRNDVLLAESMMRFWMASADSIHHRFLPDVTGKGNYRFFIDPQGVIQIRFLDTEPAHPLSSKDQFLVYARSVLAKNDHALEIAKGRVFGNGASIARLLRIFEAKRVEIEKILERKLAKNGQGYGYYAVLLDELRQALHDYEDGWEQTQPRYVISEVVGKVLVSISLAIKAENRLRVLESFQEFLKVVSDIKTIVESGRLDDIANFRKNGNGFDVSSITAGNAKKSHDARPADSGSAGEVKDENGTVPGPSETGSHSGSENRSEMRLNPVDSSTSQPAAIENRRAEMREGGLVKAPAQPEEIDALISRIHRLRAAGNPYEDYRAYQYKLSLLAQLGVLKPTDYAFYPLSGMDFGPNEWVNVIGLDDRLDERLIRKNRNWFWEQLKDHNGSRISENDLRIENIGADFFQTEKYLAQLKAKPVRSVILKGLTEYLVVWASNKKKGELSPEEVKAVERKATQALRKIDAALPAGGFVIFFDARTTDIHSDEYLYHYLVRELGYKEYLSKVLTSAQIKDLNSGAYFDHWKWQEFQVHTAESKVARVLTDGILRVLQKPLLTSSAPRRAVMEPSYAFRSEVREELGASDTPAAAFAAKKGPADRGDESGLPDGAFPILDRATGAQIGSHRGKISRETFTGLKDAIVFAKLNVSGNLMIGGGRPLLNGQLPAKDRAWARFERHPGERVKATVEDGIVTRITSLDSDLDAVFSVVRSKSKNRPISSYSPHAKVSPEEFNLLTEDHRIQGHELSKDGSLYFGDREWMNFSPGYSRARIDIEEILNPTGRKAVIVRAGKKELSLIHTPREASPEDSFERGRLVNVFEKMGKQTTVDEQGERLPSYIISNFKLSNRGFLDIEGLAYHRFGPFPGASVEIKVIDGKPRFLKFIADRNGAPVLDSTNGPLIIDLEKSVRSQILRNGKPFFELRLNIMRNMFSKAIALYEKGGLPGAWQILSHVHRSLRRMGLHHAEVQALHDEMRAYIKRRSDLKKEERRINGEKKRQEKISQRMAPALSPIGKIKKVSAHEKANGTASDERLWAEARRGNTESKKQLVLAHLWIVLRVAESLARPDSDLYMEMVQEGTEVMHEVLEEYLSDTAGAQASFGAYAISYIEKRLKKFKTNYFRSRFATRSLDGPLSEDSDLTLLDRFEDKANIDASGMPDLLALDFEDERLEYLFDGLTPRVRQMLFEHIVYGATPAVLSHRFKVPLLEVEDELDEAVQKIYAYAERSQSWDAPGPSSLPSPSSVRSEMRKSDEDAGIVQRKILVIPETSFEHLAKAAPFLENAALLLKYAMQQGPDVNASWNLPDPFEAVRQFLASDTLRNYYERLSLEKAMEPVLGPFSGRISKLPELMQQVLTPGYLKDFLAQHRKFRAFPPFAGWGLSAEDNKKARNVFIQGHKDVLEQLGIVHDRDPKSRRIEAAFVNPLFEEILYRYFLPRALVLYRRMSARDAINTAENVFTAVHMPPPALRFQIRSSAEAYRRVAQSFSLLGAIGLHAAFNALIIGYGDADGRDTKKLSKIFQSQTFFRNAAVHGFFVNIRISEAGVEFHRTQGALLANAPSREEFLDFFRTNSVLLEAFKDLQRLRDDGLIFGYGVTGSFSRGFYQLGQSKDLDLAVILKGARPPVELYPVLELIMKKYGPAIHITPVAYGPSYAFDKATGILRPDFVRGADIVAGRIRSGVFRGSRFIYLTDRQITPEFLWKLHQALKEKGPLTQEKLKEEFPGWDSGVSPNSEPKISNSPAKPSNETVPSPSETDSRRSEMRKGEGDAPAQRKWGAPAPVVLTKIPGEFVLNGDVHFVLPPALHDRLRLELGDLQKPISRQSWVDLVLLSDPARRMKISIDEAVRQFVLTYVPEDGTPDRTVTFLSMLNGSGENRQKYTLHLHPAFRAFYDDAFGISRRPGTERKGAIKAHLETLLAKDPGLKRQIYAGGRDGYIQFWGKLRLPGFYYQRYDRFEIVADRKTDPRFLMLQEKEHPGNYVVYEYYDTYLESSGTGERIAFDNYDAETGQKKRRGYSLRLYEHSGEFREFDAQVDGKIKLKEDSHGPGLNALTFQIGDAGFRFIPNVPVKIFSYAGERKSSSAVARSAVKAIPVTIVRTQDEQKIEARYDDPERPGAVVIDGITNGAGEPVRFRPDEYYNLAVILKLVDLGELPGVLVSGLARSILAPYPDLMPSVDPGRPPLLDYRYDAAANQIVPTRGFRDPFTFELHPGARSEMRAELSVNAGLISGKAVVYDAYSLNKVKELDLSSKIELGESEIAVLRGTSEQLARVSLKTSVTRCFILKITGSLGAERVMLAAHFTAGQFAQAEQAAKDFISSVTDIDGRELSYSEYVFSKWPDRRDAFDAFVRNLQLSKTNLNRLSFNDGEPYVATISPVRSAPPSQSKEQIRPDSKSRAETRENANDAVEEKAISSNRANTMVKAIRKGTQTATVFLNAEDFPHLSVAQKHEYFYAALSGRGVRIVVYNERGQVQDKELGALLKLDRVTRTDRDLAGSQILFDRPGAPSIHLSKKILPPQELVQRLRKKVSFFKTQGQNGGTLAAALLWAWSGGEDAQRREISRGRDGFWTVADSLVNALQRSYSATLAFAVAA